MGQRVKRGGGPVFTVIEGERRWAEGPRPHRLPERKCLVCGRRRLSKRCACGARESMPFLDARPVLLPDAVRKALEDRLTEAFRILREDPQPALSRHLRQKVLPHLVGRLADHRRAERMRRAGIVGYRQFEASAEAQVAFLVAVPSSARPRLTS